MMKYQPKTVQQLFSKSPETIRSWAVEFSAFLSIEANPGSSGHRRYTDDDLAVFAHVNERKGQGVTNEQIIAELTNGQRIEPPREALALLVTDERSELAILQETVSELREQVSRLSTAKDRAEGALAHSDALHRAEIERQGQMLKEMLSDKEQQVRQLLEENARLKASK